MSVVRLHRVGASHCSYASLSSLSRHRSAWLSVASASPLPVFASLCLVALFFACVLPLPCACLVPPLFLLLALSISYLL
ncbi:uncharacterized protein DS421_5g163070 [Arachis hypogaea]|nr:uncharacterized protein DS421_5g163070 [Arachis hypogaea]